MDPKSFVYSAVLLLVVASTAVAISRHFGLGSILGLLITGVIVGPYTPGPLLTTEVDGVREFTELGVVLLLFLIGLEIKPRRLWEMRRMLFGLGNLQILGTTLLLGVFFYWQGYSDAVALVLGASFALSSTAFVVQMLREQREMSSVHGQTAFAVLLMQDLAVIPLLSVLPLLSRTHHQPTHDIPLWSQLLQMGLMVALVLLLGRYVVPRVLHFLARKNNREAFFLVAMAAMFLASLAMEHAGLSMGLGAFLMGMMLSTSRYSLQIEVAIEPHKGLLMSLFFVAVGMSVDVNLLAKHPWQFMATVLVVVAGKWLVLYLLSLWFGIGRANALRASFLLAQGGEFGFVVFGSAKATGVIGEELFAMSVAVISVSMLLTPVLARLGYRLARQAEARHPADEGAGQYLLEHATEESVRVVIAGYGRVGHTIGTILSFAGIPYIAFDSDAHVVEKWRGEGRPVYYGDISNPALFNNHLLAQAELLVLTIDNDGDHVIKVASLLRSRLPEMQIVARASDLATSDVLTQLGVADAVPETLEASLRLAASCLELLGQPDDESNLLLQSIRRNEYSLVRDQANGSAA